MKKYLIAAAMAATLSGSAYAWQQPYDWQSERRQQIWQLNWQMEMNRQRTERNMDRMQEQHRRMMDDYNREYQRQQQRNPFTPWWAQ